jgi:Ion channel
MSIIGSIVAIVGCAVILIVLWDAFEAIVLPRRVTRRIRLMPLVVFGSWTLLSKMARRMRPGKRRERYLGFFGPLSLLWLLSVWGIGLVIGFAMIHWGIGSRITATMSVSSFRTDVYFSGTTFFTLGLGDMIPHTPLARAVTVIEAGVGFGFLAIVIGYLPVIYQSFSRREINISLLDARAGSPPSAVELLIRHGRDQGLPQLTELLREWERWAAELLESHLSYPVLAFFRSQHENQSWLAGLTTILDVSTLLIVGIKGVPSWQAKLTFAMARHALVDLAQNFNTPPVAPEPERLTPADLALLRQNFVAAGLSLREGAEAERKLMELRRMYEPYVNAIGNYMFMRLPNWIPPSEVIDNWQTSAWERNPNAFASSPAEARPVDGDGQPAIVVYQSLPFDLFY